MFSLQSCWPQAIFKRRPVSERRHGCQASQKLRCKWGPWPGSKAPRGFARFLSCKMCWTIVDRCIETAIHQCSIVYVLNIVLPFDVLMFVFWLWYFIKNLHESAFITSIINHCKFKISWIMYKFWFLYRPFTHLFQATTLFQATRKAKAVKAQRKILNFWDDPVGMIPSSAFEKENHAHLWTWSHLRIFALCVTVSQTHYYNDLHHCLSLRALPTRPNGQKVLKQNTFQINDQVEREPRGQM